MITHITLAYYNAYHLSDAKAVAEVMERNIIIVMVNADKKVS